MEVTEADVVTFSDEGTQSSPLDNAKSDEPSPSEHLAVQQLLDRIDRFFADDSEALLAIAGLREGLTGTEIREILEVDQTKYETIVKRLRRKLQRALKEDG